MTSREFTVSDPSGSISVGIVHAVADIEDTDATRVEPPLYEAIDPDALDHLFAPTGDGERTTGHVDFTYGNYDVSVSSAGRVRIEKGAESDDSVSDSSDETR